MIWEECKLQYKQPECGISDCSECEYRKLYNKYKHLKESIGNYKVYLDSNLKKEAYDYLKIIIHTYGITKKALFKDLSKDDFEDDVEEARRKIK